MAETSQDVDFILLSLGLQCVMRLFSVSDSGSDRQCCVVRSLSVLESWGVGTGTLRAHVRFVFVGSQASGRCDSAGASKSSKQKWFCSIDHEDAFHTRPTLVHRQHSCMIHPGRTRARLPRDAARSLEKIELTFVFCGKWSLEPGG